jgi:hypothetical protein
MSGFYTGPGQVTAKYSYDQDIVQFLGFGSAKAAYGPYHKDLRSLYEKWCPQQEPKPFGVPVYTLESWTEFMKDKQWVINWWAYPPALRHWFEDEFHPDAPAPWSEKLAGLVHEDASLDEIVRERNEIVKDQQKRHAAKDVRYRTSKSPNNTAYPQVFQPKKKPSSGGAGGAGGAAGAPAAGAPAAGGSNVKAPKPRPAKAAAKVGGSDKGKALAKPAAKVGGSDKGKAVAKPAPKRPAPGKSPARPGQAGPARLQQLDTSSDSDAPDGDDAPAGDGKTHVMQDAHDIEDMADLMEKGVEIFVKRNSFGNVFFAVPKENIDDAAELLEAGMVPYSSFAEYMCKNEGVDASDSLYAFITEYFQNGTSGTRSLRRVTGVQCELIKTAELDINDLLYDHIAYEEMLSMRVNFSVDFLLEAQKNDDANLLLKVWDAFLNPDEQDKFLQKRKRDEENAAKMHKFRSEFYTLWRFTDMMQSHELAQELIDSGMLKETKYQGYLAKRREKLMEDGGFIKKESRLLRGPQFKRILEFYVENETAFTEADMDEYLEKQESLIKLITGLSDIKATMEFEEKNGSIPDQFEKQGMKPFYTAMYKEQYMIYFNSKTFFTSMYQGLSEQSGDKRPRSPSPADGAADRSSPVPQRARLSWGQGVAPSSPTALPPRSAGPSRAASPSRESRQGTPGRTSGRERTPTNFMRPSSDAGYGTCTTKATSATKGKGKPGK